MDPTTKLIYKGRRATWVAAPHQGRGKSGDHVPLRFGHSARCDCVVSGTT